MPLSILFFGLEILRNIFLTQHNPTFFNGTVPLNIENSIILYQQNRLCATDSLRYT